MAAKGGQTDSVNDGICRHAARGADLIGGDCQVAGMDDAQVDGVLRQERMLGEVATDRGYTTTNCY